MGCSKLGGQKLQLGQKIIAWLGLANHDDSMFEDPERFGRPSDSKDYDSIGELSVSLKIL